MSTLNIPPGASFTVIDGTSISYNGQIYPGVTNIALPGGTNETPAQVLTAAGGAVYSASELTPCIKIEGIDPLRNNTTIFTCYSQNSHQTGKNAVDVVPGGMWVEMLNFLGSPSTNANLAMWAAAGAPSTAYGSTWLGFKVNYGTMEQRAYLVTHVNLFDEESTPTYPSNINVTLMHDVTVAGYFQPWKPTVANNGVALAGNPFPYNPANGVPMYADYYQSIKQINVYRTAVTSQGTASYFKVPNRPTGIAYGTTPANVLPYSWVDGGGTFPVNVSLPQNSIYVYSWSMLDNYTVDKLQQPLQSLDWDCPFPDLMGLIAYRDGIMAAFRKNEVHLCEPYRPFTFPRKYIKVFPKKILALRADENILYVLTEGGAFGLMGAHPSAMSDEPVQNSQAIVPSDPNAWGWSGPSRAVTRTAAGVIYASVEGPVQLEAGRSTDFGRALFTRETWTKFVSGQGSLGSLSLTYYDGHILGYYRNRPNGWILSVADASPNLTYYNGPAQVAGDFQLVKGDSLYVIQNAGIVSAVARFADESAARLAYTWQTKDFIGHLHHNYGVARVVTPSNVLNGTNLSLVYDGAVWFNAAMSFYGGPEMIAQHYYQRLPGGCKARRTSVIVNVPANGNDVPIHALALADSELELQKVG